MRPPPLVLLAALAWSGVCSGASGAPSQDPAVLSEMRRRRIVPVDQSEYSPEEYTLLERVREAESLGAFSLLRSKLATLKGFAVRFRTKDRTEELWLSVEGYREYLFLKSQEARAYFESHQVEAREVFLLRDMRGKLLFDAQGALTQDGDALYNRIQRKLPVYWKLADGRLGGNVRPPPAVPAPPVAAAKPPAQQPGAGGSGAAASGPTQARQPLDEAAAERKLRVLKATGYVEISEREERFLLDGTKLPEAELERQSSLQVVASARRVVYLLSPSDPLFTLVARLRAGAQGPPPKGGLAPP